MNEQPVTAEIEQIDESPVDASAPRLRYFHFLLVFVGAFLAHCFFWGSEHDVRWYRLLTQHTLTRSAGESFAESIAAFTVGMGALWVILACIARFFRGSGTWSEAFARSAQPYNWLFLFIAAPALVWPALVGTPSYIYYTIVIALFIASIIVSFRINGSAPCPRFGPVSLPKTLIVVVVLYFGIDRMLAGFFRHLSFMSNMDDLGLYDQMLWGLLHNHGFWTTIYAIPSGNFMAEHIMPSVLLLVPFYVIACSPIMLYIAQTVFLIGGAIALAGIAGERARSPWFPLIAVFLYMVYSLNERGWVNDFHADTMEVCFYLGAFYFFLKRKNVLYWACIILLLGCKEDVGLSVCALGVWMAVFERRWRIGASTAAVGFVWSAFSILYLLPELASATENRQIENYAHLGGSVGEIARTFLLSPHVVLMHLTQPERLESIIKILAPFAFIGLLRPSTLLLLIPPMVTTVLSNWEPQYGLHTHYGQVFVGPACIGFIEGWRVLERVWDRRDSQRAIRYGAVAILMVFAISSNSRFAKYPVRRPFKWTKNYDIPSGRGDIIDNILKPIPGDASVAAQNGIGAHLTYRKRVYKLPRIKDAEYVVFYVKGVATADMPLLKELFYDLHKNQDFGIVARSEGALLLQRGVHIEGEQLHLEYAMEKLTR